jgi:hypothetical protein
MNNAATETPQSMSVGAPAFAAIAHTSAQHEPSAARTLGSGFAPFHLIEKYLSNRPLRIRVADDPELNEAIARLAEQCLRDRPYGCDIDEMTQTPSYQQIIQMGHRAIRPLLLMLRRNPNHWFPALNAITGENPVSAGSEGRMQEMADAWIRWGMERGYIRELD